MKIIQSTASLFICCIFSFSLTQSAFCQNKKYQLNISITDSDGNPVSGIKSISSKLISESGVENIVANLIAIESEPSNLEGKIQFEYESIPEPDGKLNIYGEKYYTSQHFFTWKTNEINNSLIRSGEIKSIIKSIKNPIPMCAHLFRNSPIKIPKISIEYGYDLELCELMPPYGKGKNADIFLKVNGTNDGKGQGKTQITIRGNGEKTGFVEFLTPERESGSVLISDYLAPEEGFVNSISFKFDSTDMKAAMSQRKDQNYYFRVRCQLNPDGTVKSCHYGKLYGPFSFWNIPVEQGGVAIWGLHTAYFNPTLNDRNVEFDTNRNLAPGNPVFRP